MVVTETTGPEALDRCLLSVFEAARHPRYSVLVSDSVHRGRDCSAVLQKWRHREPVRFSVLSGGPTSQEGDPRNAAARAARGEFLLFLGGNTEVITPEWIGRMMEHAQRPAIGAVGAQLLSTDNTVSHAGFVLGIGGGIGESHHGLPSNRRGYFGRINTLSNVAAVSGECLMCRREAFEEVGGFDASLRGRYADADLCLRLLRLGKRSVYLPDVQLYRRRTRGPPVAGDGASDPSRARFVERWRLYVERDPYYSPHLTRLDENYQIGE